MPDESAFRATLMRLTCLGYLGCTYIRTGIQPDEHADLLEPGIANDHIPAIRPDP